MPSYIVYILEANALTILLAGIYFVIRNQLSFAQRRFSLLLIPLLALSVFIVKYSGIFLHEEVYQFPVYTLDALTLPNLSELPGPGIFPDFIRIYWLGSLIMGLIIVYRIVRLFSKLRTTSIEQREGLKIVKLENETCFSFLNYVQLNPSLSDEAQQLIFQHEKIHVAKKHSYDILFMQIIHGLSWFNPIFILIKKELTNVHEYEVDEVMYSKHKTEYMEFLLSYSLGTNSTPLLLTNQFFSSKTLIKRMKLMKQKTKNRWAFALTLPLIACSFALVSWSFSDTHKPTPSTSMANERIEGEVDKMPEFKGGQEALVNYLGANITYPQTARENKIEGTVHISFVVDPVGKVTKCSVKKGVDKDLDAEALRVISAMPDWIPGEKDGKAVNVEMILPINFKL